ncbi:MAG: TetR/AcrR family transcriptional regulator [Candidatus Omnitrophica bacterium]|nr:TetR/AcrR family transcriptional regulator [Candidatus Omnitrophota bacterium]
MKEFEKGFSLRERKQARTKVFLAKEFLEGLKRSKYEDIPIKSICEKVEVSEGTFYNYFPQKTDLINYVVTLYGTKMMIQTNKSVPGDDPIKWLKMYFKNATQMMSDLVNLSNEIFATIVRERVRPQSINFTRLEFLYMFPDMDKEVEIEKIFSIEDCFDRAVGSISRKGILRKDISVKDLTIALKMILGGTPIIRALYDDKEMVDIVQKQLSVVLKGVMK